MQTILDLNEEILKKEKENEMLKKENEMLKKENSMQKEYIAKLEMEKIKRWFLGWFKMQ